MIDLILIGVAVVSLLLGIVFGGGKVLKRIGNGIAGKIFTIVICYFTFFVVLALPVSQNLLVAIAEKIESIDSKILSFIILTIRLDLVILAIIFYFVVVLLRKLVFYILGAILEIDCLFMKIINKAFGAILSIVWVAIVLLIVFQILAWTTGVDGVVYQKLKGSFLGLDNLFVNNPLKSLNF